MSATAKPIEGRGDRAIYARLHREGRAQILRQLAREFPRSSESEIEDAASSALLELLLADRLTHWSSGAIGLWHQLSRQRMIDYLRTPAARRSVELAAHHQSFEPSAQEQLEANLSDWRAVETLAALPERAATFVQLRVLEGQRKREVMRGTGWTDRQYRHAMEQAKNTLRLVLADEESPASCLRYREMIAEEALGELPVRKRIILRAHRERCGHCRVYRAETQSTVQALMPLIGLAAPVSGGGIVVASGVGMGLAGKGAATLCIGALCLGGVYGAATRDRPPRASAAPATAPSTRSASPGALLGQAPVLPIAQEEVRSTPGSTRGADVLELDPTPGGRRGRPANGTAATAESVFGLRSGQQPTAPADGDIEADGPVPSTAARTETPDAAPAAACVPGELGC